MTRAASRIVLGTRGSDLARAQTTLVENALRAGVPGVQIAVEIITTRGDENSRHAGEVVVDRKAGRKGMFTAEIERALLDQRIDVAVHSAKDLPSDAAPGLEICAALPRAAVDDVLITKNAASLSDLPAGATIATGSIRRQYQLRHCRPDLHVVELRGNVPTRLRKLAENRWDGIVLARAGLERLGFDPVREPIDFAGEKFCASLLPQEQFVPAGGQGIVALQIRADDALTRELIASASDHDALACLRAEREFLRRLQGDCDSPVGVLATFEDGGLTVFAQVFETPEPTPKTGKVHLRASDQPENAGAALFQSMYGKES